MREKLDALIAQAHVLCRRGKYTGLPADDPLLADPKAREFHDEVVARVNFVEEMERATKA